MTDDTPHIDDFRLYNVLHKMSVMQEDLGSDDTKHIFSDDVVLQYMKRLEEELPKIKEYLASPNHMARPVNNTMASWVAQ